MNLIKRIWWTPRGVKLCPKCNFRLPWHYFTPRGKCYLCDEFDPSRCDECGESADDCTEEKRVCQACIEFNKPSAPNAG